MVPLGQYLIYVPVSALPSKQMARKWINGGSSPPGDATPHSTKWSSDPLLKRDILVGSSPTCGANFKSV